MLVGICGLAGSGKDTSADHLVAKHKFVKVSFADPLKRIARDVYAFSDEQLWGPSHMRNAPDTRYVREQYDRHDWREDPLDAKHWRCTQCDLRGDEAPPKCTVYLTPRFALQVLGTEWGRKCYPGTWVDYALRVAKQLQTSDYGHYTAQQGYWYDVKTGGPNPNVVIPDVRFKNEIDAIHAAGGRVIRIVRDGAGLQGTAGLHPSEKEQAAMPDSAFDAVVPNNTCLTALGKRLDAVMQDWKQK